MNEFVFLSGPKAAMQLLPISIWRNRFKQVLLHYVLTQRLKSAEQRDPSGESNPDLALPAACIIDQYGTQHSPPPPHLEEVGYSCY